MNNGGEHLQSRFFVRLVISSETLVPEEIVEATGLAPTEIWHHGEVKHPAGPLRSRSILHRDNGWKLHSPLAVERPLAEHCAWLVKNLRPHVSTLARFIESHPAEVGCAIYGYERAPEVHFDRGFLQMLAYLGAELNVDLYDLREIPVVAETDI